jgi:O-antigen/teichoic acid export membrane protein
VRGAYLVTAAAALLASGLFLAGIRRWSPALAFLAESPWLAAWFVLGVAAWCIFVQQDGLLTGMRRTGWVPVENTIYAAAKLVLLVLFAKALPAYGIFASWTLPALLLLLPVNWLIFRRLLPAHIRGTSNPQPVSTAAIVRYAGANHAGALCFLAYTMLPPVMVLQMEGSAASAYFYLPWVIAGLLRLVAANMSTSLVVEASLDHARSGEHFRRALVNTLRIVGPAAVIVVLAAPYLLRLFGRDYAESGSVLLQLLALAALPSAFVTLHIGLLRAQYRIRLIIVTYMLNMLFILGLSYLWLQQFGIAGVGLAWLVGQSLVAVFLIALQLSQLQLQKGNP